ncbi:MAG: hypothetical protein JSU72_13380 [Deltaproteobacteria bacterium]|nr:MAG: hypothetical protein JSU72_13380 [Deltaproteobacteria bacterium]
MKVISSRRNKRMGSVSGIESTELTFEGGNTELFRLIRGSVCWPYETFPGVVLLGVQRLGSDTVDILEERLFSDISGAVEAFQEFHSYRPSVFYFVESPESEGFLSFLRRSPLLSGKLPLMAVPHAKAVEYGNQLIGKFLNERRLVIPAGSVIAEQLLRGA